MKSNGTLGNILKFAAVAAVVYGAYKLGESKSQKINNNSRDYSNTNEDEYLKTDELSEIQFVENLINELKSKENKTKKDRDNIELLEIKLKQLKSQK
jgi:hypothetical protein